MTIFTIRHIHRYAVIHSVGEHVFKSADNVTTFFQIGSGCWNGIKQTIQWNV